MKSRFRLKNTRRLLLPAKGRLLLAEPFAVDLYFSRSVVLLLDAGSGGCMGLVLNKKLSHASLPLLSKYGLDNYPLYRGGPVDEDRLFYVHNIPGIQGAVPITENLFIGGTLREVAEALKKGVASYRVRFFLGYSGWSAGQLESELKRESWVVVESNLDVLTSGDRVWEEALQMQGDVYYKIWLNCPFDPHFN